MNDWGVIAESPWYLVLLVVVPIVWWAGRGSLSALGRGRATVVFLLRSATLLLLVLAIAELQMQRAHRAVSVVYVLDQSLSIPLDQRQAMFHYVAHNVKEHRDRQRGDRAGVIVFGRQAAVEVAPVEDDLSWLRGIESSVPRLGEATNLEEALTLAQSVSPPDCARRVVLITDGNENLGEARRVAPQLADQGIGIDVIPVQLLTATDVSVEKVVVPAECPRNEPISIRVVVVNDSAAAAASRKLAGTLQVKGRLGSETKLFIERSVELEPGKNVFRLSYTMDEEPGFYVFEAKFIAEASLAERTDRNNSASGFVNVRGEGRVLLVENVESPDEFSFLAERLRAAGLHVEVRTSERAFDTLAELQTYDTVILANVARRRDFGGEAIISDRQIEALVRNTEMGCGLVMLGGPNSFGAGQWANTLLEEASPVNFEIKNAEAVPTAALVLVLDKSGSMHGDKLRMSRQAAVEAAKVLKSVDQIGVVAFDGSASWAVPIQEVAGNREDIVRRIRRIPAGGGTNMFAGMDLALSQLPAADAALKHMVVLSDGQTPQGDFRALTSRARSLGITVSTVAAGAGANRDLLVSIARIGQGRFFQVDQPRAIPRIFVSEAMRVTKPVIYERAEGFVPRVIFPHEMLRDIDEPLPPLRGYVLTQVKQNPLVEVAMRSPLPADDQTATLLASWNYGLGRFVVFTSDAGVRWSSDWTRWEGYDAFFQQMVRWSMRPRGDQDDVLATAQLEDGAIRVTAMALDERRDFLNDADLRCLAVLPDRSPTEVSLRQTAPGRYVGELPAEQPGNYLLTVSSAQPQATARVGVNVPYSIEYSDKETNWPLLKSLASQRPAGGQEGVLAQARLVEPPAGEARQLQPFRATLAPAVTVRDVWPYLCLLAAVLFFLDILVRRVAIDPAPALVWLGQRLRRRAEPSVLTSRLERLQHRKQQVRRRPQAGVRDELADPLPEPQPGADTTIADALLEEASATPGRQPTGSEHAPTRSSRASSPEGEASYTDRLLEAKRRARRQQESHQGRLDQNS